MPLAENEIDALIAALEAARVDAIAISLLFSFLNPGHERRLAERLRAALPQVPVYLSSDVLPEIKEFERTSTTAVCAYAGPILASYLERLNQVTRARALPPLYLMGSNGGILEAAEAIAMPAAAVESGPAAGVVAAALVARQTGRLDLISFDMGGTTAKASLIRGGQYETTPDYEVRGPAGNRGAGRRGWRCEGREACHGRGPQNRVRPARPRAARFRARRLRRGGAAACRRARERARHCRDRVPTDSGGVLGARPHR